LLAQAPDEVQAKCELLQQTMLARTRSPEKDDWSSTEDQSTANVITHRLSVLKQTLLQQGASAERALATLLPERAVGSYGTKSGFSTAARGPSPKSYQA